MKIQRFATILVAAMLPLACGDGDGDGNGTGPGPVNISGTWSYSSTDLAWGTITCQMTGVSATIMQSGNAFTGTTTGGTIACQSGEDSGSLDLDDYQIVDGMISGTAITFTIIDPGEGQEVNIAHTGTVSGGSMTGNVTAQFELPPPAGFVVPLTGTWSANR